MTIARTALGLLCLLAATACVHAQQDVVVANGTPVDPTMPTYPEGPCYPSARWQADHDRSCMPYCYAYNHLAVPYELTLRVGPSFIIGGGRFDEVLQHGIAVELAARGFCYNADHSAAWTLAFGLADIYNSADQSIVAVQRENDVRVVNSNFLGNITDVPTTVHSEYGIEYLHRQYIFIEGGHEWYWFAADPCLRVTAGVEAGTRVGHAHAQVTGIRRTFDPVPNDANGDRIVDLPEYHFTDTIGGIYASVHAGVFYPRWGYDVYVGIRGEIGRDWIRIVNTDNTIDQLNVLFEVGVRF
jgi:hypothetical protein